MAEQRVSAGIPFNRPPRMYAPLPMEEVRIPAPPPPPPVPSPLAWWAIALPIVGTLVWIVAGAVTGSPGILLTSPVIFFSYGATILTYFSQKKRYETALRQRRLVYEKLISETRRKLEDLAQKQREARNHTHPSLDEGLAWAESGHQRIWERGVGDGDFLDLRMGIGTLPATFTVKPPSQTENILEADPLLEMAVALQRGFALVEDVPVTLSLPRVGSVGITGPRDITIRFVRALVAHLVVHHSPDEVKVALIGSSERRKDWGWLGMLPHTWLDEPIRIGEQKVDGLLALDPSSARTLAIGIYEILNRRESQVQMLRTRGETGSPPLPFFVIVVDDLKQVEQEAMMASLLLQGPRIGAAALFIVDQEEDTPRQCGAVIKVSTETTLEYVEAKIDGESFSCRPDFLDLQMARRLAMALFPLRPRGMGGPGELPTQVSLLDLYGVERPEDLRILDYWKDARPDKAPIDKALSAPIGIAPGNRVFVFDLHEKGHGPHGLIAGTTGSGKSELLQTMITSLAIRYSPLHVNFILVDYKGGGAMNVFRDLPHTVGLVTDLHGRLAARALIALRSELRFREALLARYGVNHIDDYHRLQRPKEPLPHLVIVIDEFAELVFEQPDFMSELISVVRRGRSLGVHLILATQRPAGVVKGDIWSNAKFRVCLRVETPEDSQEVLRRPEAASLFLPGRAYFQVGNNEVFELLQVGRAGGRYISPEEKGKEKPYIMIENEDGTRDVIPLFSDPETEPSPSSQKPPTQAEVIVAHIQSCITREKNMQEALCRMRKPWLPPLPRELYLPDLLTPFCKGGWNGQCWQPTGTWLEPVVGLLDDPANQRQEPLTLNLGEEGHLLMCGSPGSGKSTLLRTLILALAHAHSPQYLHIYILDLGGRALELFSDLPHVSGNVILPGEQERTKRLIRRLTLELDRRKELLKGDSLKLYRMRHADAALPALAIVVDNFAELKEDTETLEVIEDIAREGAACGMHLVLAADHPNAVPPRISGNIGLRLVLQMMQSGDYSLVVGRTEGLVPEPLPGRGLVKSTAVFEFQTALPVKEPPEEQAEALRQVIEAMATSWRGNPVPEYIGVLPLRVRMSEILTTWPRGDDLAFPIGLDDETLRPIGLCLEGDGPHFLVTGPPQSGKTTTLHTWIYAVCQTISPENVQFLLFDTFRHSLASLQGLPNVHAYAITESEQLAALEELERLLQARCSAQEVHRPVFVLMMDDGEFIPDVVRNKAAELARTFHPFGFHVVLSGAVAEMSSGYDSLRRQVLMNRSGLLIGSNELQDAQALNLTIPPDRRGQAMPPGRGYLVRRGRARVVQVALAE